MNVLIGQLGLATEAGAIRLILGRNVPASYPDNVLVSILLKLSHTYLVIQTRMLGVTRSWRDCHSFTWILTRG